MKGNPGTEAEGRGRRCPLGRVRLPEAWGAWGQGPPRPGRAPPPGPALPLPWEGEAEEPGGQAARSDNRSDPLQTSSQNANLA